MLQILIKLKNLLRIKRLYFSSKKLSAISCKISSLVKKFLTIPSFYWMLGCFLVNFYFFYISPVFLNDEHAMNFINYIPRIIPIGGDLRQITDFALALITGSSFSSANVYPPLFTALIVPFARLEITFLYKALTIVILSAYAVVTLIIPLLLNNTGSALPIIVLFFATGLFSYGFHFEIERGQFNLIAFQLALVGVYLFHYKPRFRWLAYLCLSIGAHIKIFPALFFLMFVDDWRDWKANLKRFIGIGFFNVALLFVLGYQRLVDFVDSIRNIQIPYVWVGNHSVKSFVNLLEGGFFQSAVPESAICGFIYNWAVVNAEIVGFLIYLLIVINFLFVLFVTFLSNKKGFDANLFLVITLTAILLPAISHDYTLSILPSAMAIAISALDIDASNVRPRLVYISASTFLFIAYFSTLFSYTNKPMLIQNNLPALVLLLSCFSFFVGYMRKSITRVEVVKF